MRACPYLARRERPHFGGEALHAFQALVKAPTSGKAEHHVADAELFEPLDVVSKLRMRACEDTALASGPVLCLKVIVPAAALGHPYLGWVSPGLFRVGTYARLVLRKLARPCLPDDEGCCRSDTMRPRAVRCGARREDSRRRPR